MSDVRTTSAYCKWDYQLKPPCTETHLVADTQRHLGNLNVDEGVVHSSSLLHLINVIDRMLRGKIMQPWLTVFFTNIWAWVKKRKKSHLGRLPERPSDPCSAVQSLGDTFTGTHSAHGVLWQRPGFDWDGCNTHHIAINTILSTLPLQTTPNTPTESLTQEHSRQGQEYNTLVIQHCTCLMEKTETGIDWSVADQWSTETWEGGNGCLTAFITQQRTSSDHPRLVFLIRDVLLFNISPREEKPHHSLEELVHELDGERHHVDLIQAER